MSISGFSFDTEYRQRFDGKYLLHQQTSSRRETDREENDFYSPDPYRSDLCVISLSLHNKLTSCKQYDTPTSNMRSTAQERICIYDRINRKSGIFPRRKTFHHPTRDLYTQKIKN